MKGTQHSNATLNRGYDFDGIGNRTSSTENTSTTPYTPNALNQYASINPGTPVTPVYDLDGKLLEDQGVNAVGMALKYTWDWEPERSGDRHSAGVPEGRQSRQNRLTQVTTAAGTLVASYTYDAIGRRVRKTTTATAAQGITDIGYVYEGWNLVAEYALSGSSTAALTQAYTWGKDLSGSLQGAGGVGGLLTIHRTPGWNSSTSTRTWGGHFHPTYDGNSNIVEYYDQTGTMIAHFEYDPFGMTVVNTDSRMRLVIGFRPSRRIRRLGSIIMDIDIIT